MRIKWRLLFYLFAYIAILHLTTNCLQQSQKEVKANRILPFTSIKIKNDDIYFTLSHLRDNWHKLLSIDNLGTDAIVKFSKDHFGKNKCDYQIECYKYNIIANFDNVFSLLQKKKFPERVGIEYEEDNKIQTGIDCESLSEYFKLNEENLADNIKQSLKESSKSYFLRGINKLKNSFTNIFEDKEKKDYTATLNLNNEVLELKKEILSLEKEEQEMKKNLTQNLNNLKTKINKDKSFFDNIWKIEIIAGIVGGVIVFCMFALYYYFNGIFQRRKSNPQ